MSKLIKEVTLPTVTYVSDPNEKMEVTGMLKNAPSRGYLFDDPVVLFIAKKDNTKRKRPIIFDRSSIVDANVADPEKIDPDKIITFEVYKNRESSRKTPISNNTQDTIEDAYKAQDTKYSYTPTKHNGYS